MNKLINGMYIPVQWERRLLGASFERQTIGESRADVFRVRCSDGKEIFLKSEPVVELSELPDEVERLVWLNYLGLPGPSVLAATTEIDRHWLLMSALPGHDLASANNLSPSQVISIMAMALRTLHQVPIAECPFDHRLEHRMDAIKDRVNSGLINEDNFEEASLGLNPKEALDKLLSTLPETHDLVVTHGDACLPNLIAEAGQFTGFIDCGRLGVSDRYQDLSIAARSIEHNLGAEWVAPFFREYGIVPDERRVAFYRLLDEFF